MLLPDDKAYLERKGYKYEVTVLNGETLVVIKDFALGSKYSQDTTDVLIRIPCGYPEAMLDQFWTSPIVFLKGTSTRPPNTDGNGQYFGKQWQCWSRHLNGWRGGIDNLETFMSAMLRELQQ